MALGATPNITLNQVQPSLAHSSQVVTQTHQSLAQDYATAIAQAANDQNLASLSVLIDDNAVILFNKDGASASLDKQGYLDLLANSWSGAQHYRYKITLGDILPTQDGIRMSITTTESWQKEGKKYTFVTQSRATMRIVAGRVLLVRAVSQASFH